MTANAANSVPPPWGKALAEYTLIITRPDSDPIVYRRLCLTLVPAFATTWAKRMAGVQVEQEPGSRGVWSANRAGQLVLLVRAGAM